MSLPPSLWFELALLAFLGYELYAVTRPEKKKTGGKEEGPDGADPRPDERP